MPQRLLTLYDIASRLFPLVIGIGVNLFNFKAALVRVTVTCISMLVGALFVHYLKPVIVHLIDKLKKN